MNRTILKMSAASMISVLLLATLAYAGATLGGKKKFVLPSGKSGYMKIEMEKISNVSVTTRADHGSTQIEVKNSSGKTIARGNNKLSFKTSRGKNSYMIIVTNNTKKIQKVELSWLNVLNIDWDE